MQQQTKLTKLRRVGLRLVCLLAAVLALSPSAGAWYVRGNFPKTGESNNTNCWDNGVDMGESQSYTLGVVSSNLTAEFKITDQPSTKWDQLSYIFGAEKDKPYTFGENGGSYNAHTGTATENFKINMVPGKKYKISFNNNTTNPVVTVSVENVQTNVPGLVGSWSGHNYSNTDPDVTGWSKEGDWFTKNVTSSSEILFRVKYNDNGTVREYQPTADNSNTDVENGTEYSTWGRTSNENHNSWFKVNTSSNYSPYKIWFRPSDGKIKVTWNTTSPVSGDVYIVGDWDNHNPDWNDAGTQITDVSGTVYTYTITPSANGDIKFRFKVNGAVYYPKGGDALIESGRSYESVTNGSGCFWLRNAEAGKTYTITFDSSNQNVKMTWDGGISYSDIKMKVYPIGIYTDEELAAYNEPTYYLLGDILNNSRVTPEYQFVKITDEVIAKYQDLSFVVKEGETFSIAANKGKYLLVYTMRNTRGRWTHDCETVGFGNYPMKVSGYASPTSNLTDYVTDRHWNELNYKAGKDDDENANYRSEYLEGWKCVAVFDPNETDDGKKLVIKKITNGKLPYISLIGAGWQQSATDGEEVTVTVGGVSNRKGI